MSKGILYSVMGFTLSVLLLLAMAGCVSGTSPYYFSTTDRQFPPKPKDAVIPIYAQPPQRPFLVIGKLAFETPLGMNFVRNSLAYNARQNGGDAVIIRRLSSQRNWQPANLPAISAISEAPNWGYGGEFVPMPVVPMPVIINPGGEFPTEQQVITAVEAEVIVFQ